MAPEAPFPRAVEEVFYVYCWALKNLDALGSTGEKIILVGDSAGGNLVTTCVINCIELGIVKPDGLLVAYGAFVMNVVKTPSRFMGLLDVYLQWSCAVKLMSSYGQGRPASDFVASAHVCTEGEFVNGIPKAPANQYAYDIPKDYLLTPYWTPDDILAEFPPTKVISMATDPCLDECIEFSKKLKKLSVEIQMDTLGKLPHGFLLLGKVIELLSFRLNNLNQFYIFRCRRKHVKGLCIASSACRNFSNNKMLNTPPFIFIASSTFQSEMNNLD